MRHFLMLLLFSALVAVVFGVTAKQTPRERLLYGLKVFGEFVIIGIVLACVLYFLPLR